MPTIIDGTTGISTDAVTIGSIAVQRMSLATAQSTLSGTSIDFTGIPTWAKKIIVTFKGVSTNSTGNLMVQIGSGSFTTSGYASVCSSGAAVTTLTNGFTVDSNRGATSLSNGSVVISTLGSNIWIESGSVSNPIATVSVSTGTLTLGDVLDRVRITTAGGTDTFDAGSVNILIEGN